MAERESVLAYLVCYSDKAKDKEGKRVEELHIARTNVASDLTFRCISQRGQGPLSYLYLFLITRNKPISWFLPNYERQCISKII
jgi:hypothetical protein